MSKFLSKKCRFLFVCEICGKKYNKVSVEKDFQGIVFATVYPLKYGVFGRKLCAECAKAEYESGNYYEVCEVCGKVFYPEAERVEFDRLLSCKKIEADMWDCGIHCASCAESILLEYIKKELNCSLRLI